MRNFTKLIMASAMLATQATPTAPNAVAASVQTTVPTVVSSQTNIVFSTNSANAVQIEQPAQPNFDNDVLVPLRAAQAAAKDAAARQAALVAQRARQAAAQVAVAPFVGQVLSNAAIQFLGNCESGMTANRNSGNGFYGAFQFSIGTWNSMGTGYARADLAPLDVQIQAVQRLLSRSSIYSQFPGCARQMHASGLI